MSEFLVKNRPTLTVMVQGKTPERICELMDKGLAGGADAFGVQLERLERKYHTNDVINRLLDKAGEKPVYITNYRDGVNEGIDENILVDELMYAASKGAALVDVMGDLYLPSRYQIAYDEKTVLRQKATIDNIHKLGAKVLISSHTHCFLGYEEVKKIADAQLARGADIVKIVTDVNSEEELQTNFQITSNLLKSLDKPYLFLCAGNYCKKHRKIAPLISNGMFLCVAERDELATPAQPLLSEAKKIIELV